MSARASSTQIFRVRAKDDSKFHGTLSTRPPSDILLGEYPTWDEGEDESSQPDDMDRFDTVVQAFGGDDRDEITASLSEFSNLITFGMEDGTDDGAKM